MPKLFTQPGSRDAWAFTSLRAARSGSTSFSGGATDLSGAIFVMRRIIQANIDRFMNLLKTETDPTRRAMETRLLADEEAKLKQLPPKMPDEKKAY